MGTGKVVVSCSVRNDLVPLGLVLRCNYVRVRRVIALCGRARLPSLLVVRALPFDDALSRT